MRAQTAPEIALLAGANYGIHERVYVANGDGTLVDRSDWVERITINRNIDQPVDELTIEFRRDSGATLSLSPLRTDSTLNVLDDGVTYSPALDANRLIVVLPATTAITAAPIAGDYKELFRGYIASIDAASPTVNVVAQDQGRRLVKKWIRTERFYSDNDDDPLETVMQQLLDDTLGVGVVTLYVVGAPTFLIRRYQQQSEPLMSALRTLANERAWDVRYLWDDTTSTFRLTLYEPPRSKTVPDRTFGPDSYFSASRFEIADEDVRNYLTANYRDSVDGYKRKDMTATDQDSIDRYEEQFYGITLGDESSLDTAAEVSLFIGKILSDLKDPLAEFEIEAQFFWPAELNDLYRFSPNAVHFNTDQDWAVTGIRHELFGGTGRTYLQVRGRPSGGFLTWIGWRQPIIADTASGLNNVRIISETDDEYVWGVSKGSLVTDWYGAARIFTTPITSDQVPNTGDPFDEIALEIQLLSRSATTFTTPKPTREDEELYVHLEPRTALNVSGPVWRRSMSPRPKQAPVIRSDDVETGSTGSRWIRIQERGIRVTAVYAQTQLGDGTFTSWITPLRSVGDASTVRGGVLGSGEYEHDVARLDSGTSWVNFRLELETGQTITLDPLAFDPNKNPDVLTVERDKATIRALADSDTKSLRLVRVFTVTMDAAASETDTTLTILALPWEFPDGTVLNFGGVEVTTNGVAFGGATSLTVDPIPADIPDGAVAYDLEFSDLVSGTSDPSWEWWQDVKATPSGGVDVSELGTNGADGVAEGVTWEIKVKAYAAPKSQVDDDTESATWPSSAMVYWTAAGGGSGGGGGAGGSSAVTWTIATAAAPSVGDTAVLMKLMADAAPASHTAHVKATRTVDGVTTDLGEITSSLTPALTVPPTSSTTYTYTGTARAEYLPDVRYDFTAEVRNATGLVVASAPLSVSYRIGTTAPPGGDFI